MSRRHNKPKNKTYTPSEVAHIYTSAWRQHYTDYLILIATQLFKWNGLPDSVDPRYLEVNLHEMGFVAFHNDPQYGYLVSKGAPSGTLDVYNQPIQFHAVMPNYQRTFRLNNYVDIVDNTGGVLIRNNDLKTSTYPVIELFAEELAQLKAITRVNLNAQKTPYILGVDENDRLSVLNMYQQIEMNTPAIFVKKDFDIESLKVFSTPAPYLADKLNVQRMNIWNEFMTFLGIENANIEKRERLVSAEVNAIGDQVANSVGIMMKARMEACELINQVFGLNVSVELRTETIALLNLEKFGGVEDGDLHNGTGNSTERPIS